MIRRNWPDFEKLLVSTSFSFANFMRDWLEANIPKEVLDKVAPPICENHEPFLHNTGSITYVPNGCTTMSNLVVTGTCKHCGAEIKPSGWILR